MPAQSLVVVVGAHYHCQRIPANQRADTALHEQIAGHALFSGRLDGVAKGRGDCRRKFGALLGGVAHQHFQEIGGSRLALMAQDTVEGIQPFLSFLGV